MVKKMVDVRVSEQARLMLDKMPGVSEEGFITWFCERKGVSAGGGNLIDYLRFLKEGGGVNG